MWPHFASYRFRVAHKLNLSPRSHFLRERLQSRLPCACFVVELSQLFWRRYVP